MTTGASDRTIGWYVHHHGRGHLARFLAVRPHLDAHVVCFSTMPAPEPLPEATTWILLDRDDATEIDGAGRSRAPVDSSPTAAGLLHWAPLGHHGHRSRLARIALETMRQHLDAFVVDVSAEVTLFARLLGLPVIVLAQPGDRRDEPHRLAFRAATRIIAPWPAGLVTEPRLDDYADVVHTGGISRFDGRERAGERADDGVVLLLGAGGHDLPGGAIDDLQTSMPGETWTVLDGARSPGDPLVDPWGDLCRASVTISWAGQNSIADLAASDAPAIVIPQSRPFDEQLTTARALHRAGLAVVEESWPTADRWPAVIERARRHRADWALWQTAGAARRAARAMTEVAERW